MLLLLQDRVLKLSSSFFFFADFEIVLFEGLLHFGFACDFSSCLRRDSCSIWIFTILLPNQLLILLLLDPSPPSLDPSRFHSISSHDLVLFPSLRSSLLIRGIQQILLKSRFWQILEGVSALSHANLRRAFRGFYSSHSTFKWFSFCSEFGI